MAVETFFVPSLERLATKMRRDIHTSANDLAALNSDIDLAAALVSGHCVELRLECLIHEFGEEITGACRSGGAAFGRLTGFDDIRDRLDRTVGAEVEHRGRLFLSPDKFEFPYVEFNFLTADDLIEVQAVNMHKQSQAIALSKIVDVICCDDRAGARHVLHHEVGVAGNVFRHVARKQPCPTIVEAARRESDDDAYRFSAVKGVALSL